MNQIKHTEEKMPMRISSSHLIEKDNRVFQGEKVREYIMK